MEKIKIIIEVKKGMVTSIQSSDSDKIDVILIDWDNINAGDEYPTEPNFDVEPIKKKKIFFVYTFHEQDSKHPPFKKKTYEDAVDEVHEFFLSYGFEIRNGLPYDKGNEDENDPQAGYSCFTQVKMYNGKVANFVHCNGDGPIAFIQEI